MCVRACLTPVYVCVMRETPLMEENLNNGAGCSAETPSLSGHTVTVSIFDRVFPKYFFFCVYIVYGMETATKRKYERNAGCRRKGSRWFRRRGPFGSTILI